MQFLLNKRCYVPHLDFPKMSYFDMSILVALAPMETLERGSPKPVGKVIKKDTFDILLSPLTCRVRIQDRIT